MTPLMTALMAGALAFVLALSRSWWPWVVTLCALLVMLVMLWMRHHPT